MKKANSLKGEDAKPQVYSKKCHDSWVARQHMHKIIYCIDYFYAHVEQATEMLPFFMCRAIYICTIHGSWVCYVI